MRTVTGPTDRDVAVGAGLGLPAALHLLGRGYPYLAADYVVDHIDTPLSWAARAAAAGSPSAPAHVFRQTGPFRRRNLTSRDTDLVLARSGTTPGVGVPTVLISGKLAARRICGRSGGRRAGQPWATH